MAKQKCFDAEVYVSVDDFRVEDILDYIIDEAELDEEDMNRLREFVSGRNLPILETKSLADVMKVEAFQEAMDKYSLDELQRRLS